MFPLVRIAILLSVFSSAVATSAATPVSQQKLAYEFGRCVVDQDREAAVQLINRLPLRQGEISFGPGDLGDASSCLVADVRPLSPITVRGGIAQALFLRDFREFGVEPRRAGEFANLKLPAAGHAEGADQETHALYSLGDCVVRNRTNIIDSLLVAPVGSALERQLIDRLVPIMGACHAPGAQAKVSRADLRSILAQSAYAASARYWSGRLNAVLN
jgi:hypothetical protein